MADTVMATRLPEAGKPPVESRSTPTRRSITPALEQPGTPRTPDPALPCDRAVRQPHTPSQTRAGGNGRLTTEFGAATRLTARREAAATAAMPLQLGDQTLPLTRRCERVAREAADARLGRWLLRKPRALSGTTTRTAGRPESRDSHAVPGGVAPAVDWPVGHFHNDEAPARLCATATTTSKRLGSGARDARSGRPAVVTDDDVRSLAITAGSEHEPIVGRRAPNSSRAGVWPCSRETLAITREESSDAPLLASGIGQAAPRPRRPAPRRSRRRVG
jgi:hypothetical protein